jgi:TetR/AcrR family transcriptional repressor of nem operon
MGRPRQFDTDDVVERAMRLFWRQGYEATSISDLVDTLGINRFSLYETFGDKRGLFLASLARYTERVFAKTLVELEGDVGGLQAIDRYFRGLARWADGPLARQGCLLVNTVTEQAGQDRALGRQISLQMERVEAAFRGALVRAQARGDVRCDLVIEDHARLLALVAQGALVNMVAMRSGAWIESAARVVLSGLRA